MSTQRQMVATAKCNCQMQMPSAPPPPPRRTCRCRPSGVSEWRRGGGRRASRGQGRCSEGGNRILEGNLRLDRRCLSMLGVVAVDRGMARRGRMERGWCRRRDAPTPPPRGAPQSVCMCRRRDAPTHPPRGAPHSVCMCRRRRDAPTTRRSSLRIHVPSSSRRPPPPSGARFGWWGFSVYVCNAPSRRDAHPPRGERRVLRRVARPEPRVEARQLRGEALERGTEGGRSVDAASRGWSSS